MADQKISNLTAIAVQSATDIKEVSLNGTGSRKETRAQEQAYWQANLSFLSSLIAAGNIFVGDAGGNASSVSMSGDASIDSSGVLTLATVLAASGSYSGANQSFNFTFDAPGRVTNVSQTPIQIAESQVTNLVTDLAAKLNLSGGTMTGDLTLNADPVLPLDAATKQYVDAQAGDIETITGTINQINVDATDPKNVILSTPQDIAPSSSPTFGNMKLEDKTSSFEPTLEFSELTVPVPLQVLSKTVVIGRNALANPIYYSDTTVYPTSVVDGFECTGLNWNVLASGNTRSMLRYDGTDATQGVDGLLTIGTPVKFSADTRVSGNAVSALQVVPLQQLQAWNPPQSLTQGYIFIGDITNIASGKQLSNDVTLTVSGDITINKVQTIQSSANADNPLAFFASSTNSRQAVNLSASLSFNPSLQIFKAPTLYTPFGDGNKIMLTGDVNSPRISTTGVDVNFFAGSIPFGSPTGGSYSFKTLVSGVFSEAMNISGTRMLLPQVTLASTAFTGALIIGSGGVNSVGIGGGSISVTGNITAGGAVSVGAGGQLVLNGRTDKRPLVMNGSSAATSDLVTNIDWASPVINSQQNAFNAYMNATVNDVTGDGTQYVILYNSAPVNKGTPVTLNTATGVITVQKTGNYLPAGYVQLSGLANVHTTIRVFLLINGATRRFDVLDGSSQDRDANNQWGKPMIAGSIFLTAGDIITVNVIVSNGAKVVDLFGAPESGTRNTFSMNLLN